MSWSLQQVKSSGALSKYCGLVVIAGICGGASIAGTYWFLCLASMVIVLCLMQVLQVSVEELLVVTIPISFYSGFGSLVVNLSVSDFLLVLVVVQLLLVHNVRNTVMELIRPLMPALAAIALLMVSCGGTVYVRSLLGAETDWVEYLSNSVKLVIVVSYFFVCIVAFTRLDSGRFRRLVSLWAFTAAMVGIAGTLGSILYPLGIDIGMSFYFRATATFEDPNAFASYLVLSIPICFLARHLRGRHLYSWHLLPILAGIYTSYSRGAVVALVVMLIGLLVFSFGRPALRSLRIVAAIFAVSVMWLIFSGAADTMFEDVRGMGFETDVRFKLWQAAWDLWLSSPIFGVGLGQFVRSASTFIDHGAEGVLTHSTYLSILSETGVVGFALFSVIPCYAAVALLRDASTGARLLTGALLGVLVMAASLNLQNSRSLWVLLALAIVWTMRDSLSPESQIRQGDSRRRRGVRVNTVDSDFSGGGQL